MGCCGPGAELAALLPDARAAGEEVLLASRVVADGVRQTDLSVPAVHCGACIRTVEKALGGLAGVESARVNLSTRRATVRWRADGAPPPFIETLKQAGFEAHLFDIESGQMDGALSELIRALAVAGFAASNIMLLSVSIWSGAEAGTRDLFHWLSAIIALPALAYSGRIFFRSAWQALRHRRTNMDVPISLGVLLAFGMSLYETAQHGPHAYFDAAISLLFFLLIGRTLDHMMRERARLAVKGLAQLAARGALVMQADGTQIYLPVSEIADRNDHHAGGRRTCAGRCNRDQRNVRAGRFAGLRRANAGAGDRRDPCAGRHVELDRAADHRRHGDTGQFVPRRDGADDGSGRTGPLGLSPHRRSRRQPLCAGRPSHGLADVCRLARSQPAICIAR